jgi:hypothetical protein
MAKNKLSDLNDHLFLALERLNDEELKKDEIEAEAIRVEAIIGISAQIISNAKTTIDAMKLVASGHFGSKDLPDTFGIKQLEP